jgi:hypothetical protein
VEHYVGIDVSLEVPAKGKHDWAAGAYFALHCEWKRQLEAIVGRLVSLEAIVPGTPEDAMVRRSGVRLRSR